MVLQPRSQKIQTETNHLVKPRFHLRLMRPEEAEEVHQLTAEIYRKKHGTEGFQIHPERFLIVWDEANCQIAGFMAMDEKLSTMDYFDGEKMKQEHPDLESWCSQKKVREFCRQVVTTPYRRGGNLCQTLSNDDGAFQMNLVSFLILYGCCLWAQSEGIEAITACQPKWLMDVCQRHHLPIQGLYNIPIVPEKVPEDNFFRGRGPKKPIAQIWIPSQMDTKKIQKWLPQDLVVSSDLAKSQKSRKLESVSYDRVFELSGA